MLRILTAVTLLGLAGAPAFADDCDFTDAAGGTGATAIAQSIDAACHGDTCGSPDQLARELPDDRPPPPRARHGMFAGGDATVGTIGEARSDGEALSGGELIAHGQAGWRSGLRVCGRTEVIAGTTSRGDSAFHVAFPWPFFEAISLGGEQKWQLRPRLDDARIYLRRLYSSTEVQVGVGVVAWARADGGSAAVLPLRFALLSQDQDRTGAVFRTWRFAAYESTHPDRRTEVLPMTIEAMYPHGIGTDQAPTPASSYITRLDVVDLSRRYGDVHVELAAGYLFADRPLRVPVAARAAIAWGPWSLGAERAAHLAMDQSITVEDRLSAGYHEGMLRAGAFVARTHTSTERAPQLTGGGSAGLDVALPEAVQLALDVEVARSYYARLDGDAVPTPELAGTGTVKLSRSFNVNPTAH